MIPSPQFWTWIRSRVQVGAEGLEPPKPVLQARCLFFRLAHGCGRSSNGLNENSRRNTGSSGGRGGARTPEACSSGSDRMD
jgi:hypothetical protein